MPDIAMGHHPTLETINSPRAEEGFGQEAHIGLVAAVDQHILTPSGRVHPLRSPAPGGK